MTRVTNEQAKAVIACSDGGMECPSTCPNYGVDDCPIGNVADYMLAADLLDARELIKEFRKIGQEVINWNVSYIPLIELLEKTKDYA